MKKSIDHRMKSWRRDRCALWYTTMRGKTDLSWSPLDPMDERWPCFGWSEAWFASLFCLLSEWLTASTVTACLWSGAVCRLVAAFPVTFFFGKCRLSPDLYTSGLNPGHERKVWCHEQHIRIREEGSASRRGGGGDYRFCSCGENKERKIKSQLLL